MSKLNGDNLGAMGESRFSELCARAGLIANKSDARDRAGWDYIVNFDGASLDDSSSLDKRRGPPSCVVQVKTTTSKVGSVRLNLAMAARLAKDLHPCFIYVLKVDESYNYTDAYLIHVAGDRLAAILKRLRKESREALATAGNSLSNAEGDIPYSVDVSKKSISFVPTAAERLEVSGHALRSALEAGCGRDMATYGANKARELRELGYKETPYRVDAIFDAASLNDFEDALLGSGKAVVVTELAAVETRFEIELPEFRRQKGVITIHPTPGSTWRVTFRAPGMLPASFDGVVYTLPPRVGRGRARLRFQSRFVEILINASSEEGSQLTIRTHPPDAAASLEDWSTFFRISQAIHLKGVVELETRRTPVIRLALDEHDIDFPHSFAPHLDLCDLFSLVAKHAGIDADQPFDWVQVMAARGEIVFLHALITGAMGPVQFKVPQAHVGTAEALQRFPFANMFSVGDTHIGCYMLADIAVGLPAREEVEVSFSNFSLRDARVMTEFDPADAFASYMKFVRMVEKTDNVGVITVPPRAAIA